MSARWPALPGLPKVHPLDVYPELRPSSTALRMRHWETVAASIRALPAGTDLPAALHAIVDVPGSETFLEQLVDEQESSLPQVMLAARYIKMGWDARTGQRARFVSRQQFAVFHEYLWRAERLLADVIAAEPDNTTAWAMRLATARGLEFGQREARRRYAMAAANQATPLFAQRQLLQQLCPKWSGSFDDVHAFARECMASSAGGTLNASIVAEGHYERVCELPVHSRSWYLRASHVVDELHAAAEHSVLHPCYQPVYGWVLAHNMFGFLWFTSGSFRKAAQHFRAVGNRAGEYPWFASRYPVTRFSVTRYTSLVLGR